MTTRLFDAYTDPVHGTVAWALVPDPVSGPEHYRAALYRALHDDTWEEVPHASRWSVRPLSGHQTLCAATTRRYGGLCVRMASWQIGIGVPMCAAHVKHALNIPARVSLAKLWKTAQIDGEHFNTPTRST